MIETSHETKSRFTFDARLRFDSRSPSSRIDWFIGEHSLCKHTFPLLFVDLLLCLSLSYLANSIRRFLDKSRRASSDLPRFLRATISQSSRRSSRVSKCGTRRSRKKDRSVTYLHFQLRILYFGLLFFLFLCKIFLPILYLCLTDCIFIRGPCVF